MGNLDLGVSVGVTGEEQAEAALRSMGAAVEDVGKRARAAVSPWEKETEQLNTAMQESILRLTAQRDLLKDPAYQQSAAHAASLRDEIKKMTGATVEHEEKERGIFSNMRTRREAMVMAHEAMMGQYKNLMGSAMVFAEYADLSIMHTAAAMINPYTIAAAAVAGVTVAMMHFNEEAAENYHKLGLVGMETGATAEQMIAFEHAAIGTNVTSREMATALSHFTLNLSKHREELERVGITAKDPIQAFEQLMDVARSIQDPIQRDQILHEALGESYRKLVPLVMQGGDALREAIDKMKVPDDVKEDWEEMNALQIANAKAWDEIKHHASGTMSGVGRMWAEYKAGFMDRAAQEGIGRALLNVVNPFDDALMARGREVGRRLAEEVKKGAASGASIIPEDVRKMVEEAHRAASKTSMAKELAAENAQYNERRATFVRYNQSTEELEEAHQKALADIRERWNKKGKKDHSAEDAIREEEARGKTARAYAERIYAEEAQRREKSAKEYREYEDDEAKSHSKRMIKQYHDDMALEKRNLEVERKLKEYYWDLEREAEEHNAKMVEGAWQSTASSAASAFSSAFQEIGKKHGDLMGVLEDQFTEMLNKMASDLAANAFVFGLLSLVAPEGAAFSFASGAGGLTGALLGQRATGGSVMPGGSYIVGERQAETFRATVPGQITNHTTNHTYGAVTVNVSGGGSSVDANAIAQAVVRAQSIQSRKRAGGSF